MSSFASFQNVVKRFDVRSGFLAKKREVQALRGVSLDIFKGETLALVGESGSGKTTLGRCLMRLLDTSSGQVVFDGVDVTKLSASQMRPYRRRIQMIFQDPFSSLNPRMTVRSILEEPLVIHRLEKTSADRAARVKRLLGLVGLPVDAESRFPHEFSGGQRQRIGIARALAVSPELIVCDEPVSALDVSIQAQILNLLMDLQKEMNLTYLFISHDLRVVRHISHRIAVMYLGRIVELADRDSLYQSPRHPYTRALLSAVPVPDPERTQKRVVLAGDPPSPIAPPSGCAFHPRCPKAEARCRREDPTLEVDGAAKRAVACFYPE